ncbi:MAG: bifunctional riboflavin kinase/FAD synthetase [Prosthecobacter sp.]|jgi:riboflavin kinase/FMN adenylyltransferase|uniref:bifunctional riboflavin kinase/FAD synthetase n=1 Tax=Prosthecobacter sp. TaxID=1965333 RepID=UPI0019F650F7|nr:bifunctional riboflavin kinase/FAD synthetase [Prosthecobacter sp.]MBE2284686.1 bifunctional riboflavin kinase/FAD synthetase [Prosthecobacter sp.]
MQVLRSIDALSTLPGPLALAAGVFDGVHLGHQEVIEAAQEHATQHHGTAVVVTFDPHPAHVLRPGSAPKLLCGPRHQQQVLSQIGLPYLLTCPFTAETARTPAREFIQQLVHASQPLGCISVGYTWNFGHKREGDIHLLMELGRQHDFAVYGVPPLKVDGTVVSSTLIREAVSKGDFATAARFLGREYSVFGTVVEGRQLGRQLGFPTANVAVENEQLPPLGVYAVQARIHDTWLPAVANLGRRPTVAENADPSLEVHLLDWSGDLYRHELEVRFTRLLRPEMKFNGLDELRAQIARDIEAAK